MIILLLATSAPVAMLLSHLLLQRTIYCTGDAKARLKLVIRIVVAVTAVWGVLSAAVLSRLPLPLLLLNTAYVMIVSFGLGMCYFNVFALSETALRIRLLLESYLAEKRGDASWEPGIPKDYDAATLIKVRIDRLLAMGAVREENGKILAVSTPLVLTSKLFHFIRSIWKEVLFGSVPDDRTSEVWKDL